MRTTRWLRLAPLLALLGCGEAQPDVSIDVSVHTESDPGVALSGVAIQAGESPLGSTDPSGTLRAQLSGPLGATIPLVATCPEGHRAARGQADVTVRPLFDVQGNARGLDVTLSCPPASRRGVLVVRAGGDAARSGLPVWIDGAQVAVTDTSGVAHVPLEMTPGESFRVELATATVAPTLRPSDPATQFTFRDQDEIFVFDQRFDEELPPTVVAPRGHGHRPPPVEESTRPVQILPTGR